VERVGGDGEHLDVWYPKMRSIGFVFEDVDVAVELPAVGGLCGVAVYAFGLVNWTPFAGPRGAGFKV
jgi:hypothetical protein